VSEEIDDLTNYFIKNFYKMNMSKGSINLVTKYDKYLAHAVKSSVHAFTYYWPTWPENVGKIPKGFAIYLDHKLVQENHSMLRDIVFHELCHAKMWIENVEENDHHGPLFLQECHKVAAHFRITENTLIMNIIELGIKIDGSHTEGLKLKSDYDQMLDIENNKNSINLKRKVKSDNRKKKKKKCN